MGNTKISLPAIFIIIILLLYMTNSTLDVWSLASYALFYLLFIKFVQDLGSEISIRNIIALIAVGQYLVGASLGYQYDAFTFSSYRMAVPRDTYFSFVLPATVAYLIGLYYPILRKRVSVNTEEPDNKENEKFIENTKIEKEHYYHSKGILLIFIGFAAEFMPFLGFVGYLLSGLKYIGAFYMFASSAKSKYYWMALVFGYLFFVRTLGSGMFHDFILWGSFLVMMYYMLKPGTFQKRLTTICLGVVAIFLMQLVKSDYRASQGRSDIQGNSLSRFVQVLSNKITGNEPWFSPKATAGNVVRLNQGWIVSNVMQNIPANRPFAKGESIKESLEASILPRFVSANKAGAGGHINMQRYAGYTLNKGTSMDIGQEGEAYANYGVSGGIFYMLILGFFFNIVLSFISHKSIEIPELIFWLPLMFLQVIKSETSLVTILNHLVKASFVTWFFFIPIGKNLLGRGMRVVDSFSNQKS